MIHIDKTHPLWNAWDDDDWNGATAIQFILSLKGKEVVLDPPETFLKLEEVVSALEELDCVCIAYKEEIK